MSEPILDPDGDILLVVNRSSASGLSSHVNELESTNLPIERLSQVPADHSIDVAVRCSSLTTEAELKPVARFRASSKHLALASLVFRKAIQPEDIQSHISREHSFVEMPLTHDDPDALLVLLCLIHGQFEQVPREVNLGTLTQIAILAG